MIVRSKAIFDVLACICSTLASTPESEHLKLAPHADINPSRDYQEHNISVPVEHFHNESRYAPHSSAVFNPRHFFDASYYKPGEPVIILRSGEFSAIYDLPYLQKGIISQLAKATGGIGVVLEHRYYGKNFPVANQSAQNLRFLTTEQAMADHAYFSSHVVFPGYESLNLTAPGTPHISYGASYAGAFVAFLRIQYPELTWGAISSSGVTAPVYDCWHSRLNSASAATQPVILIKGAVQHWDENGLFPNQTTPNLLPAPVRNAQAEMTAVVQEWMMEWRQYCTPNPGKCSR